VIKDALRRVIKAFGYELLPETSTDIAKDDIDPAFWPIYEGTKPYTMTSMQRMYALYESIRYVVRAGILGAFVECGVWKGGSAMLAARTLSALGAADRDLYLYDTFAGMSLPGEVDVDVHQRPARVTWDRLRRDDKNEWCYASLDEVRTNMSSTGYPPGAIHYVKGLVEETIPASAPASISILRLDTDWYESTRHELIHLFPLLVTGGVLILDDYGFWEGHRRAVDEYFTARAERILLQRIDSVGRVAVKMS